MVFPQHPFSAHQPTNQPTNTPPPSLSPGGARLGRRLCPSLTYHNREKTREERAGHALSLVVYNSICVIIGSGSDSESKAVLVPPPHLDVVRTMIRRQLRVPLPDRAVGVPRVRLASPGQVPGAFGRIRRAARYVHF